MMPAGAFALLYQSLAETLAPATYGPPAWLNAPGREWPLFEPAVQIAAQQTDRRWGRAVEVLAAVRATSPTARRTEYEALFVGQGHPLIWLYESHHVNGRIPGPATFTVKSLYEQAGLETAGAELPDHAALELSFLAYLCQQECQCADSEWSAVRRLFIKKHAGRWLPGVGRALIHCEYPAWAAVGHLLIASLSPSLRRLPTHSELSEILLPLIVDPSACNLCGFCVQSCPTSALGIREDAETTSLWLSAERCVRCEQCVHICTPGVLVLEAAEPSSNLVLLHQSQRAACPACGAPTVSQAELKSVAARLGEHPAWLDYCLDCRPLFLEMNR